MSGQDWVIGILAFESKPMIRGFDTRARLKDAAIHVSRGRAPDMADRNKAELDTAHRHSFRNRDMLARGGKCGCFYCLRTFDAGDVIQWVHDDATALCPLCGIDAVLSSRRASIEPAFLLQMHAHWFRHTVRVDLSDGLAMPRKSASRRRRGHGSSDRHA